MREIKFRAWDDGKMIYTDSFEDEGNDSRYDYLLFFFAKIREDSILMQYTGLKDKNGKEICEGDIVKFHYFFSSLGDNMGFVESEHELTGVVEYGEFGWGISAIKGEHWRGYTGFEDGEGSSNFMELMMMNESSIHEESFEVIGNIYEDHELVNTNKEVVTN